MKVKDLIKLLDGFAENEEVNLIMGKFGDDPIEEGEVLHITDSGFVWPIGHVIYVNRPDE